MEMMMDLDAQKVLLSVLIITLANYKNNTPTRIVIIKQHSVAPRDQILRFKWLAVGWNLWWTTEARDPVKNGKSRVSVGDLCSALRTKV